MISRLLCTVLLLLSLPAAGAEEPFVFQIEGLRNPFRVPALALDTEDFTPLSDRPARSKEFLESMPLDSLRLVAILLGQENSQTVAMLEDAEGTGHLVRVGNHLGQHEGRITRISDGALRIEEPAPSRSAPQGVRIITLTLHTAEELAADNGGKPLPPSLSKPKKGTAP
ncbi:MAG: pilus assembly protein PilP [Magnetococcales bacterium]|nr:pilus assembly protein PilP [Magnetococcales bacterium]MBF0114651.1 pilus assembly protein PilP [Magnetococcales bacterium]